MISNMSGPVDQLDARLIGLLRDEPRIGLMEVARRLQVARGTVQARLAKLNDRGVIRGFGPELDTHRMGYPLMAFVFLQITQGQLKEAVRVLEEVPEVLEATATSGPSDLLCRIVARDTEHLQDIVNRALSNTAIRRTTSYIALSEQIPYRTGPLLEAAADQATSSNSGSSSAGGAAMMPRGSESVGSSARTESPAASQSSEPAAMSHGLTPRS
jgi:DNA-binding Lrp family transcriptional regulator